MITLVIAPYFEEYEGYLIGNKIKKKELNNYKYIRDKQDIRGYDPSKTNSRVIIVNKHRLNSNQYELLEELENKGFRFEEFNY